MRRRRAVYTIQSIIPREDMRLVKVHENEYGALDFIIDVSLFFLTGGLWAIWIFVREMRRR